MVAFLLLHWDETFQCCHFPANTIAQCAYNTLRPIQFLVSFVCAAIIVVFYVVYFNPEEEARAHPTGGGETWWKIQWKISVLVVVCLCVGVSAAVVGNPNGVSSGTSSGASSGAGSGANSGASIGTSIGSTGTNHNQISVNNGNASNTNASNAVDDFTSGLSICAAIITSVHWMPQVLETWRLQSLGSLSMALLVLQSFGCILTFVSVSKGGIMIGVPYLVASFMQFVLMGLSLMFWCRDRTKQDLDERGLLQRLGSEEEEREEGYSAM